MSDDPTAVEESTAEAADDEAETSSTFDPAVETLLAELEDDELLETARDLGERFTQLEADLEETTTELKERTEELEDVTDKLAHSRADFQNYKKRMEQRRNQSEKLAVADLITKFSTVRNNLVRALEQDENADIRPGVESTLSEFDSILEGEDVSIISPTVGQEVDPNRHEVMMRVESDQPAGTIAEVYQDGYALDDRILQAAQVTVSQE